MDIFQKYPDSRRMDHLDFADVAKTTFAKGVIGDGGDGTDSFFVTSSIPIQVQSMVRVEGDAWGVSDFIPLFYHPKANYWNDQPPSGSWGTSTRLIPNVVSIWDHFNFFYHRPFRAVATDYVPGSPGYFERAWQSFRCGDEVAVMLQEGVPIAVVGHADGVPRVGEDLMNVCWRFTPPPPAGLPPKQIYRACVGEYYASGINDQTVGEDGIVLHLNQPSKIRSFTSSRCWYREFFIAVGPIYYVLQQGATFNNYGRMNLRAALYSKKWLDALPNPIAYEASIYEGLRIGGSPYWWGPEYPFSAAQDCFTDRLYWAFSPFSSQWIDDVFTVPHTKDGVPEDVD